MNSSSSIGCYVRQFDAVGTHSAHFDRFVCHVGLALDDVFVNAGESFDVRTIDMEPPLPPQDPANVMRMDVFGAADLTQDDRAMIRAFIDGVRNEYAVNDALEPSDQYCVQPHFVEAHPDESVRRFSCAGFVYECYRELGIVLVDLDRVPCVGVELLKLAYPRFARSLDSSAFRKRIGLSDGGPWPVLLPGYLFHSLKRGPTICRSGPYQANSGDELFP
jgi:hypothetical protein